MSVTDRTRLREGSRRCTLPSGERKAVGEQHRRAGRDLASTSSSGSLVVPARCGLRRLPGGAHRHRVFLTIYYTPSSTLVRYHGALPVASRGRDVGGVRIDDADLLRGPRRAADAPGAPLGGAAASGRPAAPAARSPSSPVAFRKPRRWQWVLLFGVFVAALTRWLERVRAPRRPARRHGSAHLPGSRPRRSR